MRPLYFYCSLICVLFFYSVESLCFWCFWCFLGLFYGFVVCKIFCKKKKKFKIGLITSIALLLKFILLQAWIFLITIFFNHHNIFEWLQCFQVITILSNHHNIFEWLQYFQTIAILSNHHHIFEWLQYFPNYHNTFKLLRLFLNDYNTFKLSEQFQIITIIFEWSQSSHCFLICDTAFMKIAQSINSIIKHVSFIIKNR